MKIVHVASEFAPWVRVGHLADVVGGVCAELARLGHEVSVFVPGYRQLLADPRTVHAELFSEHVLELGDTRVSAHTMRLPVAPNLTLYFVRRDESFDRTFPYGPPGGEYEDSDTRFLIFCKAVADALCRSETPVDVVHCHDWPTALLPLFLRVEERKRGISAAGRTVFSIHHPAFQGVYPRHTFSLTNLPEELFTPDALEFFGQINFLKGGLVFADALLASSAASAREIPGPAYAFGLEGVLARRSGDLRGLLTGLNYDEWNPATDQLLPANFHGEAMAGKAHCRESLRKGLNLYTSTLHGALIAAELPIMPTLGLGDPRELLREFREDTVLVLLGRSASAPMEPWRALAGARPGRVVLLENFEPGVLHRVLGGADLYLGTTRIEPSPHRAQRALCYGAVPVMPRTGGPTDVILDADAHPETGNGLLFDVSVEGWRDGLRRAQDLHHQPERCGAIRSRALSVDSSWKRFAPAYAQLYKDLA